MSYYFENVNHVVVEVGVLFLHDFFPNAGLVWDITPLAFVKICLRNDSII